MKHDIIEVTNTLHICSQPLELLCKPPQSSRPIADQQLNICDER